MPNKFTESTVEEAALEWFEELGHGVLHGPEIAQLYFTHSHAKLEREYMTWNQASNR